VATITPRDNGPYLIEGDFQLVSQSGKVIPHQGTRIALCRCGGSQNKPFCDATHRTNGFQSAEPFAAQLESTT